MEVNISTLKTIHFISQTMFQSMQTSIALVNALIKQ